MPSPTSNRIATDWIVFNDLETKSKSSCYGGEGNIQQLDAYEADLSVSGVVWIKLHLQVLNSPYHKQYCAVMDAISVSVKWKLNLAAKMSLSARLVSGDTISDGAMESPFPNTLLKIPATVSHQYWGDMVSNAFQYLSKLSYRWSAHSKSG